MSQNWGNLPTEPVNFAAGFDSMVYLPNYGLYIMKDHQYIRISNSDYNEIHSGYPKELGNGEWGNLPTTPVDFTKGFDSMVLLDIEGDKKLYITKGNQYIRISDPKFSKIDSGYPSPLTDGYWGSLPTTPVDFTQGFDSMVVLNDKLYITKGDQYIRLSGPSYTAIDHGYPKSITNGGRGNLPPSFAQGFDSMVVLHVFGKDRLYVTKGNQYLRYTGSDFTEIDANYPQPLMLSGSNLSSPQHNYDMVVAETQVALNSRLREFVRKFGTAQGELIFCYVHDGQNIVAADYNHIQSMVSTNIFDIPDSSQQTSTQKADADTLVNNAHLACAFKVQLGRVRSNPDIMIFDQGDSKATYRLFFKEFQILNISPDNNGYTWQNLTQDTNHLWTFSFIVDLNFHAGGDFSKLPTNVQNRMTTAHPNTSFSVSQLYFDLDAASLHSSPTISGLAPSSNAYTLLKDQFIKAYLTKLQNVLKTKSDEVGGSTQGNFIVGYNIQPTQSLTSSSLTPSSVDFLISPFYESPGHAASSTDLYTLNYLVMSQNRTMPTRTPFPWNWLNNTDSDGTMTLKKDILVSFLKDSFSPSLSTICKDPHIKVVIDGPSNKMTCCLSDSSNSESYRLVNDGGSHVLTLTFTSPASESSDSNSYEGATARACYTATSDIYLDANIIRIITEVDLLITITFINRTNPRKPSAATQSVHVATYRLDALYQIMVDEHGALLVNPGSHLITDHSKAPNDLSGDIFADAQIDRMVQGLRSQMKSLLPNFLTNYETKIKSMLKGSHIWTYPGGDTFMFKDVSFSDYQDLVAHITMRNINV